MKYLKHINEALGGVENIISDINDMLYELRDEGFNCEVNNSDRFTSYLSNVKNQLASDLLSNIDSISISIDKAPQSFSFDEVSDCIHRIFDYTYEKGCIIKYNIGYERIKYDGNFDNIKIPEYSRDGIFNIIIYIEFGIIYKRYKHIRQYDGTVLEDKLFENKYSSNNLSQKDLVNDINDILLELKDIGFSIVISRKYIRIGIPGRRFNYDEVDEYIERLKEYLGPKFIKIDITRFKPRGWFNKKDPDNIIDIKIQYNDIPEHVEKWINSVTKRM